MYHYVRDVERTRFPGIKGVSVAEFRRQVEFLKATFEMVPIETCLEFLTGKWQPRRDICILTFDDGLIDHYEIVAPILEEVGAPGAFFLPTAAIEDSEVLAVHMNHFLLAYLGTLELRRNVLRAAQELAIRLPADPTPETVARTYRWDDPETGRLKYLINHQLRPDTSERILAHFFPQVLGDPAAFARDLYVNWDQAGELQNAGFHVGGHTHRHKPLAHLTLDDQQWELDHSLQIIQKRLGELARGFAFPYGRPATYTAETIDLIRALGYTCAFTTTVGDASPGCSLFEIPRIDPKDL